MGALERKFHAGLRTFLLDMGLAADVWCGVVEFLSLEEVLRLLAVNRHLWDIGKRHLMPYSIELCLARLARLMPASKRACDYLGRLLPSSRRLELYAPTTSAIDWPDEFYATRHLGNLVIERFGSARQLRLWDDWAYSYPRLVVNGVSRPRTAAGYFTNKQLSRCAGCRQQTATGFMHNRMWCVWCHTNALRTGFVTMT